MIGRYEFLKLLGGGGAVYGGREHGDLGLTHEVAIKVLGATHQELGGRATFADEARILSRIAHPCVVPIRNFAVLDDEVLGEVPVIVMPQVHGLKLSTLLLRMREHDLFLPLPATLHLLLQLADALETVHGATDEQGRALQLVHRDLKPGNLMVSAQGDLRVLDFGIAWASGRSMEKTRGVVKGTLRYLSPEQLLDEAPDARSDLYSLGAVAFEMLVGEPFVATEGSPVTSAVLRALLETRLVDRLPDLRGQLAATHGLSSSQAEHVTDLLVRVLQTDRERRFPHARALSAALESVAVGQPVRRGRRWLAAVVGGLPVTDGSWASAPSSLAPVVEAAEVAAPEVGRSWWVPVVVLVALSVAVALLIPRTRPQEIQLAEPFVELPVAKPATATVQITHAPPLRAAQSGARVFRAELTGGASECVPRLQMRAAAGGAWMTRPMRGEGASWELRLDPGELDAFVGGIEYWIRCGSGQATEAQWGSAQDPALLTL